MWSVSSIISSVKLTPMSQEVENARGQVINHSQPRNGPCRSRRFQASPSAVPFDAMNRRVIQTVESLERPFGSSSARVAS